MKTTKIAFQRKEVFKHAFRVSFTFMKFLNQFAGAKTVLDFGGYQ